MTTTIDIGIPKKNHRRIPRSDLLQGAERDSARRVRVPTAGVHLLPVFG